MAFFTIISMVPNSTGSAADPSSIRVLSTHISEASALRALEKHVSAWLAEPAQAQQAANGAVFKRERSQQQKSHRLRLVRSFDESQGWFPWPFPDVPAVEFQIQSHS